MILRRFYERNHNRMNKWLRFYERSHSVKTITLVDFDIDHRPYPNPDNLEKRLDWAETVYRTQMERLSVVDDDRIPFAHLYTGTELFAEAFGCKVHRPLDDMPFALPCIESASEIKNLRLPDVHSSTLSRAFEFAHLVKQRTGPEAPMSMPDIQSPLDVASLIMDKTEFFALMLEDPPAVRELISLAEQLICNFLDEWFAEFGDDYIAHYPEYYMHGGLTLSEDEVGVISPQLFEEYCLEPLNRLSERYGGIGIHCCANSQHQWENFRKIHGLKIINIVQSAQVTKASFTSFSDICCQFPGWCGDGSPSESWLKPIPQDAHMVLHYRATTVADAVETAKKLRELEQMRK
jgi:hypothetical protein